MFFRSQAGPARMLDLRTARERALPLRDASGRDPVPHRAIGIVYHPEWERSGNYVPTVVPRRYDALVHFATTRALTPLAVPRFAAWQTPDTWPSGL